MRKFIIAFLFFSVMLFNVLVNANDINSINQQNVEKILKCSKEIPDIPPDDMEKIRKHQTPDNENTKCLLACIFKSVGMMDDQGMLSVEGVNEIGRMYMSEDPERSKQTKQFADACVSVNDVEVSDGDKGCERAALMLMCGVEKVPEINFI